MSYMQTTFIVVTVFISVCRSSCVYKKTWKEGLYQVPTLDIPITSSKDGLTLFECLANCFVHTETCFSLNYWTNTTRCDFFMRPEGDEDTTKLSSENVIHSLMPPEMKDVVGGCSDMQYPCFLDRFNRPRFETQVENEDDGDSSDAS